MDIPINQIRGLAKPLKASLMESLGLFADTQVIATSAIAIIEIAPIGIALPIMAEITPINIANRSQAFAETSCGIGMRNQIIRVSDTEIMVGMSLNPIESYSKNIVIMGFVA